MPRKNRKEKEIPLSIRKLTAIALSKDEQWEESIRAFGDALADDPSDGDMRRACAEVLWDLGFHKEAASVLADYLDPFREFIEHQQAMVERMDHAAQCGAGSTVRGRAQAGARARGCRASGRLSSVVFTRKIFSTVSNGARRWRVSVGR